MQPPPLIIVTTPLPMRPGYFEARLAERVLCAATRSPFLDGCRRLLVLGHDPGAYVVMRGLHSSIDRLRARLGTAGRLTVAEGDHTPRFRPWKPLPLREGSPPIAPSAGPVPFHPRAARALLAAETGGVA